MPTLSMHSEVTAPEFDNLESKACSRCVFDQTTIRYETCTSHFAGRRSRSGVRAQICDVLRSVRWTSSFSFSKLSQGELIRLTGTTICPFLTHPLYQRLPTLL